MHIDRSFNSTHRWVFSQWESREPDNQSESEISTSICFQENYRTSFDTEITELPEADQVIKNQNANIKSQLKESIQNKMLQENSGKWNNFDVCIFVI